MESLFLINPRRKKSRKGRMPAGLRRYWAARRAGKSSGRKRRKVHVRALKRNPRRSRRRARNPRRHYKVHRRRARNPIFKRRRARHRHRNPFSTRGLMSVVKPAAIGAGGAIVTAIAYGYASPMLPATLTTGYFPVLVKAAAAVALGMVIGKFMSRQDGQYATIGGLTVVLVGAITPLITSAAPSVPGLSGLAGYGDYIPYTRPGMGAYMKNPSIPGRAFSGGKLGYVSPAPIIGNAGGRFSGGRLGAYMTRSVPGMADLQGGSGYTGMNDGM